MKILVNLSPEEISSIEEVDGRRHFAAHPLFQVEAALQKSHFIRLQLLAPKFILTLCFAREQISSKL